MRKLCVFAILLFSVAGRAQKNDIGLFGVGNFNGGSFFYGNDLVAFSYRSSAGGGAEYRRWLTPNLAAGLWFETNPSAGEQFTDSLHPYIYDFKLERYEVAVPVTLRFWTRARFKPFAQLGPGYIVTHAAPDIAGWSEDLNIVAGGGADYQLGAHWQARAAVMLWDGKQGCFGDPRCKADYGQAQTARVGVAFGW